MPSLSSVMQGTDATWGEQYDKGSLRGVPFWIHNVKRNEYDNPDPKTASERPKVYILVLDITLNGSSRRDPHAVIIVGDTKEREAMVDYFVNHTEPLGPCHTFEVPLKHGQSFWRIEDFDEEILSSQGVLPDDMQFDADGRPVIQPTLPSGK